MSGFKDENIRVGTFINACMAAVILKKTRQLVDESKMQAFQVFGEYEKNREDIKKKSKAQKLYQDGLILGDHFRKLTKGVVELESFIAESRWDEMLGEVFMKTQTARNLDERSQLPNLDPDSLDIVDWEDTIFSVPTYFRIEGALVPGK